MFRDNWDTTRGYTDFCAGCNDLKRSLTLCHTDDLEVLPHTSVIPFAYLRDDYSGCGEWLVVVSRQGIPSTTPNLTTMKPFTSPGESSSISVELHSSPTDAHIYTKLIYSSDKSNNQGRSNGISSWQLHHISCFDTHYFGSLPPLLLRDQTTRNGFSS